ncbi:hypothetical protein C0991_008174 [Blastosporella zonata]|nr:hypothetical protein C0991_008174 [Blastosporella zonata]
MSTKTKSSSKPTGARKSTPKQPLTLAERLKRLFTSLCAQIDGGHFANAIKTCDKILRLEPADADANQTKLFLLLQTEQYDAALSLIDGSGEHAFERAYSLYRLQHEEQAKSMLEQVKEQKGDTDRAAVHLEAQMNYRDGSYEQAVELYNQLLETAEPVRTFLKSQSIHSSTNENHQQSEEYSDILTNLQAAQKHLDFITTGFLHALDALPTSLTSTMESAPPPTHVQSQSSQPSAAASGAAVAVAKISTAPAPEKKVRKSRVPKGVVPGVTPPPDPERWLKKSERSTFGQGRRRKGQGGSGATQGSASVEVPVPAAPASGGASKGKGKKKK